MTNYINLNNTISKIEFGENEEVKSYIRISYDHFTPDRHNGHFRDCIVEIDIICHPEY